jgi:uncharacterized protein (DUF488 family)
VKQSCDQRGPDCAGTEVSTIYEPTAANAPTLLTIGHSTLPLASFLRALKENGCRRLVDVRRFPGSRKYPQYGQEQLFASLNAEGISAVWREGLGGRRTAQKNSINTGWRNESFRGYADYMQTLAFAEQMDWLMGQVDLHTVAIMCAEAVPWRCHRSLIGDAVLARGSAVEDVFVLPDGRSSRKAHRMTPFAQVKGRIVTYHGPVSEQADLLGILP